jgi:hypothetical protein
MKIVFILMAYAGLAIILICSLISFSISTNVFDTSGILYSMWMYPVMLFNSALGGILGTGLALVGGLIGKPRHFWISSICAGVIYGLGSSGMLFIVKRILDNPSRYEPLDIPSIIRICIIFIPCVACIIGGIVSRMRHEHPRYYQ